MQGKRFALWMMFAVLVPVVLVGRTAYAQQDPKAVAKQHFSAGEAKFKAGDYRGAIAEFTAADALVPSPILSYNVGLCHERLGEDELAVQRYRDYLQRRPDASNRAQVEDRIKQAEERLAARKAPPPAVTEGPSPPSSKPAPVPGTEGPAAPKAPSEGPAAPSPGPAAPGGVADESLAKRLPSRPTAPAPAPAAPAPAPAGALGALAAPPTTGDAEAAPEPTAPIATDDRSERDSGKKAKPIYKEWWFWAVVGVSTIIVIDMLNDSDDSSGGPVARETPGGAVLIRF